MHWFECLMNNLNEMDNEKRSFALSLINNPINISETDIRKYLPSNLAKVLCALKKYALLGLRGENFFIKRRVENFGIKSYVLNSDGSEKIIDNYRSIKNDYRERIKEDLIKNNFPCWDKLSYQKKVNLYVFYAFSEFIFYVLSKAGEQ